MTEKIKKILMSVAALAALAVGGAALANAQSGGKDSQTAAVTQQADSPEIGDVPDRPDDTSETNGDGDRQDGQEPSDRLTASEASQAKEAALATVGNGKVTEISRETRDENSAKADKPEPGDTPDPAYKSQIAYDVEVTKSDGTVVDVHLDKTFKVLGTSKADRGDGDGEHAHDGDAGKTDKSNSDGESHNLDD